MESRPATMTKASRAGATPLHRSLPEEIIFWEILVRLPPKSLLRCRAVCHAWRRTTSTHAFLQAHHECQPSLPIVSHYENCGTRDENILAFDHRAAGARLQPVVGIENSFWPVTSCNGLLILTGHPTTRIYSIYNPATRQHAPLRQLSGFTLLGMYAHRPTGEYRLLLRRTVPYQIRPYVFALGSGQPPRYIKRPEAEASACLYKPIMVRDSLHWYPMDYQSRRKKVIVFDTVSESFRQMRAPIVPAESYIFEMDGTLGIYSYDDDMKHVDIWVLQNYESEVWAHKYNVKFPNEEMERQIELLDDSWNIGVHSLNGDVLLLISNGRCMFYVDMNGQLVEKFHLDGQHVYNSELWLKQTLVPHTCFTTLKSYAANTSPFV